MPRGVYPRKKKPGAANPAPRKTKRRDVGPDKLLTLMRAERERLSDRLVAFGTAIEALEAIES